MFRTGARRGRVGGRLEVAGGLGRSSRSRDGADAASSIGRPFGASRVGGGTPRARARIIASIAAPDDPSAAAGVPRTPPSRPVGVGGATPGVMSPGRSSTSFAIALVSAAPLRPSGREAARDVDEIAWDAATKSCHGERVVIVGDRNPREHHASERTHVRSKTLGAGSRLAASTDWPCLVASVRRGHNQVRVLPRFVDPPLDQLPRGVDAAQLPVVRASTHTEWLSPGRVSKPPSGVVERARNRLATHLVVWGRGQGRRRSLGLAEWPSSSLDRLRLVQPGCGGKDSCAAGAGPLPFPPGSARRPRGYSLRPGVRPCRSS